MTAVAVQRSLEQQHPHEYNQGPSLQPANKRQNTLRRQSSSGSSQSYDPTATPPNTARSQNAPPLDRVVRTPSRVTAKDFRNNRSADGASVSATANIMPAQHANATSAAGRTTNGTSQRRIDTIMGGNINAGRRNQSSTSLSSQTGINGKTNGETSVARRQAPPLQRSKSDYGPRKEEAEETEDNQDWGARHGFDGHYASDEFVSQLVHVSRSFHLLISLVMRSGPSSKVQQAVVTSCQFMGA